MKKKELLNSSFKDDSNTDYLLKQYELFVSTALEVSERREKANTFFVSLHTALLSITGFIFSTIEDIESKWLIILTITGIFLCYYWSLLIKNYKQLNSGKFAVIHELEDKLPIRLFAYEWYILGEGKNPEKYKSLASIERNIPFLFGILYITITAYLSLSFFVG